MMGKPGDDVQEGGSTKRSSDIWNYMMYNIKRKDSRKRSMKD